MSFSSTARKGLLATVGAAIAVVIVGASSITATAATSPGISVTQSEDCTTYVAPSPTPTGEYLVFVGGDPVAAAFPAGSSVEIGDPPGTDVVIRVTSGDETVVYFDGVLTIPACEPAEETVDPTPPVSPSATPDPTTPPSTDPGKKPVKGSETSDIQQQPGSPLAVGGSITAIILAAVVAVLVTARRRNDVSD